MAKPEDNMRKLMSLGFPDSRMNTINRDCIRVSRLKLLKDTAPRFPRDVQKKRARRLVSGLV